MDCHWWEKNGTFRLNNPYVENLFKIFRKCLSCAKKCALNILCVWKKFLSRSNLLTIYPNNDEICPTRHISVVHFGWEGGIWTNQVSRWMVSALASHRANRCPYGPHVVLLTTCYDNSMLGMTWPLPCHCRCPEIVLVQKSTLKYVDFVVVFAASRICCCRFAMVKPSCLTRLSGYGARFPSIDAKWTPFLPWNQPINSSQWRF